MKVQVFIFIILTAVVVIVGHAFLFFSWVKFFGITALLTKKILAIALAVLSLSFVITSLLIFWHENAATDIVYTLASTWLGTMWYLFLATSVMWLVFWIARPGGIAVNLKMINGVLLLLAFSYAAYGMWNAQHPVIKRIEVSIPNLPATWQGRTAVQISDVHLGAINRTDFFRKVINKIKSVNPDIIFITGDLFDGGGRDLHTLPDPLNELRPPLGMYFITGNHETYINVDKALAALQGIKMTILRDQIVDVDGVQIVGIDYPIPGQSKDFSAVLNKIDRTKPNITLYHEPAHLHEFKQAGVNVLLSGHTHRGQMWPFELVTQAVYHHYDYGLRQDGDFTVYTSTGVGTWGPPMRTGNRPEIVAITFH
jgi:uncharacterized protein